MSSIKHAFRRQRAGIVGSIVVAALVVLATASSPAAAQSGLSITWGKSIVGSGKVIEVARIVGEFDRVTAADGIRVVLRRSGEQKVVLRADDNIEPLVETSVEGGTLKLRMKPRTSIRTSGAITVTVDYKALIALSLKDGASAELDALKSATFKATVRDGSKLQLAEANVNDFELLVHDGSSAAVGKVASATLQRYKVSDGARLAVDGASGERVSLTVRDGASATLRGVATRALDLSVTDGARAEMTGVAEQQSFSLSDAASVNALQLQGSRALVRASDGSSLKLGVVQRLDADVVDGSSVSYSGDPLVTKRLRDGATVKRI